MKRSLSLDNGLVIPSTDRHSLIIGKPGSGKSVFLSTVLKSIIAQDHQFIVYDRKGEYHKKFFNPSIHRIHSSIYNDFSIESLRPWINGSDNLIRGIFVPSYFEGKPSDTSIATEFFDTAINTLLSSPDSSTSNIHFILDNLDFPLFENIVGLLTQSRSKGANVWLSFQNVSQIRQFYSDPDAISNVCYNIFSFSLDDDASANYITNRIQNVTPIDLCSLPALKFYAKCGSDSTCIYECSYSL